MASPEDLRRIALSFPGVEEGIGKQLGYGVKVKGKSKGIAWEWMERVIPKKPRQPNPGVYAIKTPNLLVKEARRQEAAGTDKFVEDPHYNGFPALLVRLDLVSEEELRELFEEGYHSLVPA